LPAPDFVKKETSVLVGNGEHELDFLFRRNERFGIGWLFADHLAEGAVDLAQIRVGVARLLVDGLIGGVFGFDPDRGNIDRVGKLEGLEGGLIGKEFKDVHRVIDQPGGEGVEDVERHRRDAIETTGEVAGDDRGVHGTRVQRAGKKQGLFPKLIEVGIHHSRKLSLAC